MALEFGDICPIGVFDSGLGGLSVLAEIHQLLPHENLIYVGDSANAPYGDRSAAFVRDRSKKITHFLLDQGVKAIVIACNTATAEAATLLRERVDVPVIGLEPAIKPAAQLSNSGIISVLATQRTINSERLLGLTERHAKDKKVLAQACPGLVEQVEACDLDSETTLAILNKYIQPLLEQGIDALILGCTHYPFLLPAIRSIVGDQIEVLETGRPVAIQLQRVLKEFSLEKTVILNQDFSPENSITFYNSSVNKNITSAVQKLWKHSSAKAIDVLPLPTLE